MARNRTLTQLLDGLRAETRRSLNSAHNVQVRDTQIKLLQRTQEFLWEDFTWPHLRVTRDITLQAGQRYYDLPDDLDIERVEKVQVKDGDRWCDISPNINTEHYNTYDSDLDIRSWPVQRYQIAEDNLGASAQLEVWPIPDGDGDEETLDGTLRLTGIRNLRPLVADADQADLDDRLIVLYAAAEDLAAAGSKDAALKLNLAKKLDAKLRGNLTKPRRFRMFGADCDEHRSPLRGPPTVYYRTDD